MSAAKWHRRKATLAAKNASAWRNARQRPEIRERRAAASAELAAHHATAADALEALAVVADVLLAVAAMRATPGTQEHRDALSTLARIASESK